MIKKLVIFYLFTLICFASSAQEYLTGLQTNPALSPRKNNNIFIHKQGTEVRLPFLDDFSYSGTVYPADTLWEDRDVFINTGYPVNPPSVGVATFDAINDTGAVYPYATTTPFIADYLTSLPIRLDSIFTGTPDIIEPADSVYFSFFYQPQGVADAPSVNDSLILEFYSPHLNDWRTVWGSPGMKLDSFLAKYNTYFKQVLISITDTTFIQKDFQFRFKNYASIAALSLPSWQSNVDQWNIDYVYLNTNRSKQDTLSPDITYVDPAPSILKNYTQMPARQFNNTELTDTLRLKMSNLNSILDNISCQYVVKQIGGAFQYTKSGGVFDINPFFTSGYHDYPLHIKPDIDFTLPSFTGIDSIAFSITHMTNSNGWTENILSNDTISYRQEFYNSFAYDDGSAEKGYGLSGENAKLAYRFNFNQADTLGGIQIYFNQTLTSPYNKYFYLTVWSSLSPETIIYTSEQLRPEFEDNINAFHTFIIDDTTLILSGTFYVGWKQLTDDNLNIGYDKNTNAQSHTFFNVDGSWSTSSFNGSLMIRPLIGTSWQEYFSSINEPTFDSFQCMLYPNPVSGEEITLLLPSKYNTDKNRKNITMEMFDYVGRKVMEKPYSEKVNISDLSNGMYYLRLVNSLSNTISINKLVIAR